MQQCSHFALKLLLKFLLKILYTSKGVQTIETKSKNTVKASTAAMTHHICGSHQSTFSLARK